VLCLLPMALPADNNDPILAETAGLCSDCAELDEDEFDHLLGRRLAEEGASLLKSWRA
jgi:hypothetical protein